MLIIERGVGKMAKGRAVTVYVDGGRVGTLKQRERVIVEREAGGHAVHVEMDDASSEVVQVRLANDHDTSIRITTFPRWSWRDVWRRTPDAYRFDVIPGSDRL